MSMSAPFTVTLWDGQFNRLGWVGDPLEVEVTERFNDISTGRVVVPADHRRIEDLTRADARVTVDYEGRRVLSGPVRSWQGASGPPAVVEAEVQGDFRLLHRVLGWPTPGAALTSQTSAYDVRSGPAETVLKGYVTANAVTRLGLPVTVAPDQARGSSVKVQSRFHPLVELLLPAVETAGLGVSVVQGAAGLVVDVYAPQAYPRTLTVASGVVHSWEWSVAGPSATRVIAGDQGEGAARSFTRTIDTARETEWGDVVEVLRDARDTDDADTVTQRRADALAEGAPKRGLKVELAESKGFRYGQGIGVGDTVTVEVAPGITVTDVLREAVLSWTTGDGFTVSPVIGERSDDPSAWLAKTIRSVVKTVGHLKSSR